MDRNEFLETQTFKSSGMDTSRRVLEVLAAHEKNAPKLLSHLIAKLEDKGLLSADDIDDLLLNTI